MIVLLASVKLNEVLCHLNLRSVKHKISNTHSFIFLFLKTCVRLFTRSSSSMDGTKRLLMATGGTDSCVRVWDVNALLEILASEEAEEQKRQQQDEQQNAETSSTRTTPTPSSPSPLPPIFDMDPSLEITVGGGDVLEIDASPCGQMLFSVGARDAVLWDSISGAKLATLPQNCPPIDASFKAVYF